MKYHFSDIKKTCKAKVIMALAVVITSLFCCSVQAQSASSQWSIELYRSFPFYFFKKEASGNLTSQGALKNSWFGVELHYGVRENVRMIAGLQGLKRNFSVDYQGLPGQLNQKQHNSSFYSVYSGIEMNIKTKEDKFHWGWNVKFWYSQVVDDIKFIYNDTIQPDNYTIKSRQLSLPSRALSASIGIYYEKRIMKSRFGLRIHPEMVLGLLNNTSTQSNATNRFLVNFGIVCRLK